MTVLSHFLDRGDEYAAARPRYPAELFQWLASQAKSRKLVWDCGTGSGQAALGLARHFEHVIATDISDNQIAHAQADPRIAYAVCSAENPTDQVVGFNVVTCACSLHWFELSAFYKAVWRLAAPEAFFCAWTYEWPVLSSDKLNDLLQEYKNSVLKDHWAPEAALYLDRYRSIEFPFVDVSVPPFSASLAGGCEGLLAFLRTWSAVKSLIKQDGEASIIFIEQRIREHWDLSPNLDIQLPLYFRSGYI